MNSLRVNARVALFCLGAIGWSAESAWAADVAAGEEETLEEVVVTGTNIRGVAPTGSALIAIDRETIDNSSAVTVTSMLLDTPQVMNFGITESSRSGNGGSGNITFGSGINIRGISPFGTLTLLNGRRIPPNGTGGAAPDPNVIPTIALERIEIIADGASAVYGSDAIAGVANLVLRRNVKGFEANVRYGAGSGYSDRLLNAIWGHSWGSGRVTIAAENGFHTALKGPDRSFLRSDQRDAGGSDYRVAQCAQGNLTIGNLPTTGGTVYPIPASGVTAATLVAGNRNLCDNIKNLDIIPKQDHRTAAVTFDQAINQTVDVFAEGYFARRDYERNVPTPTLSNAVVPTTNAFYIRPATAPAAGNLVVNYSFARDYGPTNKLFNSYGYAETYYVLGGARVKLPADWRAELTVSYGRDKEQNNGTASLNTAAITTALASNNPATSLNVYGTTVNDPTLLANLADRVAISPGRSIARNVTLAFDGKLFSMPGGDARAAVGVGRLYSSLYGGQVTGGVAAPASLFVFSERVVKSVYVEFALPLVGEGNAVRGVRSLQLSLAGRQENYTEFGKTSHPKVGLDYSPVAGLKLHASYGTAFRAPGLVQLKGLATPGFFSQNYQDPLANNGAGGTTTGIAINGSNPNLLPEKATTYSAGIEWAPEGKPFGVSLNYFDIDYRGQIVGYLSNLSIVGNPAAFEGVVYKRRPSDAAGSAAFTAMMQALINEGRVLNGTLTQALVLNTNLFVDGRSYNTAVTRAKGVDFDFRYNLLGTRVGDFRFGLVGSRFLTYKSAPTSIAPETDVLNRITYPFKLRSRVSANWSRGEHWSGGAYVNYTNGYTNDLVTPIQEVGSYVTFDWRLNYKVNGWDFGLDTRNLFNRDPPFVNSIPSNNGGGGFDPNGVDTVGRLFAVSIGKKF